MNLKRKISTQNMVIGYFFVIYIVAVTLIYGFFIHTDYPYAVTDIDYRLWADAVFYKIAAQSGPAELISISKNYFGPVLLYKIFKMQDWLIYVFNISLLTINVYYISVYWRKQAPIVLLLLLLNPLTLLSLFFVNKEIIGLTSVTLFMVFMHTNRMHYLVPAMLLSLLVRWQLGVTFLIMFPIIAIIKNGKRQWLIPILFSCLIGGMTILYPIFLKEQIGDFEQQAVMRSNLTKLALQLQDNFLFILAFPIKVFLNLFGNPIAGLDYVSKVEQHRNVYDVSVYIAQVINILAFLWIVVRGRWASNRTMAFLTVYLVLFTATPFIQTRYFYPIFPIIYMMAATPRIVNIARYNPKWKLQKS